MTWHSGYSRVSKALDRMHEGARASGDQVLRYELFEFAIQQFIWAIWLQDSRVRPRICHTLGDMRSKPAEADVRRERRLEWQWRVQRFLR